MVSMVRALQSSGHEVLIMVVAQEPYEDRQEGVVHYIYEKSCIESQVITTFDWYNPDVVVVRDPLNENVAPIVAKISIARKVKCLSYEQNACYHSNPLKAICIGMFHVLKQMRKGLPVTEISPKRGAKKGYPIPFRRYFDFPMTQHSGVEDREYFPDGIVRVTAIGKLGVARKRLDWVIDALGKSREKVRVVLVGANDLDRYPNRSRNYYNKLYQKEFPQSQAKSIEIRENVPFNEMSFIYENTDIFVLPSRGEKFGISPLEAMSYGCAVVCADDNGSSAYIEHDYDGWIFKSLDYEDFEEKICSLTAQKNDIIRLGQTAVESVKRNHGYSQFVNKFMSVMGKDYCGNLPEK